MKFQWVTPLAKVARGSRGPYDDPGLREMDARAMATVTWRNFLPASLLLVACLACGDAGDESPSDGGIGGISGGGGAPSSAGAAATAGTGGGGGPPGNQPTAAGGGAAVTGMQTFRVPERGECQLDSGFPGDSLCILAPEPGEGVQIHVGPTDYDDPGQINEFLLASGEEKHEHYYVKSLNTEDAFYFPRNYRMRPGSHHMIIHRIAESHAEGWGPASSADLLFRLDSLEGAQNTSYDVPPNGVMPPENAALGMELPARSQLRVNLHHFNASQEATLREVWVNVWFKDPAIVRETSRNIFMLGGLLASVGPGATRTLNYECALPTSGGRLLTLFGHRHAHTPRFSAWLHRGGERDLVYEDHDWMEPTTLSYDSLTQNPAPDARSGTAGGESGVLEFGPGDRLEWECEVVNDSSTTLRFSNQVNAGEMCILFGTTTGSTDADCTHF